MSIENYAGNGKMAINSKAKGKRAELQLVNILKEHGYPCRRSVQYSGKAEEGQADIIGLDRIHIECKAVEKLNVSNAIKQAIRDCKDGEMPTVFHKKNREGWLVTMRIEDWLRLYGDGKSPLQGAKPTCEEDEPPYGAKIRY